MSAITLEQARAQVAALMEAQAIGNFRSVSIGGRSVSYASLAELRDALDYWIGWVSRLERSAAGLPRIGYSVGDFRSRR